MDYSIYKDMQKAALMSLAQDREEALLTLFSMPPVYQDEAKNVGLHLRILSNITSVQCSLLLPKKLSWAVILLLTFTVTEFSLFLKNFPSKLLTKRPSLSRFCVFCSQYGVVFKSRRCNQTSSSFWS